jgi:hypothetical protein
MFGRNSRQCFSAIPPYWVSVIADSEFSANRRTSRELKSRLAGKNVLVIYTQDSGAVKIVADNGGWKLQAMDGQIFQSR